MYHGIYAIWGLLPFTLLCLSVWAVLKPWLKVRGRENPKNYFTQFIYCSICLVAAIFFDQMFLDSLMAMAGYPVDPMLVRWLLYPAALFVLNGLPMGRAKKKSKPQRFVFTSW